MDKPALQEDRLFINGAPALDAFGSTSWSSDLDFRLREAGVAGFAEYLETKSVALPG